MLKSLNYPEFVRSEVHDPLFKGVSVETKRLSVKNDIRKVTYYMWWPVWGGRSYFALCKFCVYLTRTCSVVITAQNKL